MQELKNNIMVSCLPNKRVKIYGFCNQKQVQLNPNNLNPDSSNSWIFRSRIILPNISLFKFHLKNIS